MKKKILGVFISLLVIAMLATPAMAEPTKGQKVPATMTPGPKVVPPPPPPPDRRWRTNGDIRQTRGEQTNFYPVTLTIGSDEYTDGTSRNLGNNILNFKAGWLNSRDHVEFTFPSVVGGFEGNIKMKLEVATGWYSIHCVLFGFGDFEGQMLMLSYAGPPSGAVWIGYCLKG